eukprot:1676755-Lingulodinium_polyedra.AAC.1
MSLCPAAAAGGGGAPDPGVLPREFCIPSSPRRTKNRETSSPWQRQTKSAGHAQLRGHRPPIL